MHGKRLPENSPGRFANEPLQMPPVRRGYAARLRRDVRAHNMRQIAEDTILTTRRLRLRAANLTDVDLVWSASRFDGFNDGMTWDPPGNKAELVDIAHRNLREWNAGNSFTFTSELIENNVAVGRVGIRREASPSVWGIGFWVHPYYWGCGYAAEAAHAVIHFGFSELSASKIVTAHAIWNTRSQRVIEKLGFRFMGENPCGFEKHGQPVAEYEYEIESSAL